MSVFSIPDIHGDVGRAVESLMLANITDANGAWIAPPGTTLVQTGDLFDRGDDTQAVFKLFAALGAWLGWSQLPLIILLASVVGAVVGIGLMMAKRAGRELQLPFGPYLAAAGWIALLWGDAIALTYLQSVGL